MINCDFLQSFRRFSIWRIHLQLFTNNTAGAKFLILQKPVAGQKSLCSATLVNASRGLTRFFSPFLLGSRSNFKSAPAQADKPWLWLRNTGFFTTVSSDRLFWYCRSSSMCGHCCMYSWPYYLYVYYQILPFKRLKGTLILFSDGSYDGWGFPHH